MRRVENLKHKIWRLNVGLVYKFTPAVFVERYQKACSGESLTNDQRPRVVPCHPSWVITRANKCTKKPRQPFPPSPIGFIMGVCSSRARIVCKIWLQKQKPFSRIQWRRGVFWFMWILPEPIVRDVVEKLLIYLYHQWRKKIFREFHHPMKRRGEKDLADEWSSVQLPQSSLMHPTGEGGGAAWASLYIYFLWLSLSSFLF